MSDDFPNGFYQLMPWQSGTGCTQPLKKEPALTPDEELLQELAETKWKFRSDVKIQIEGKDEIKARLTRSPDKADALANTFYPQGL